MKQIKCPNCGSRTTDVEVESYAGRCITCRKIPDVPTSSAPPPLFAPTTQSPAFQWPPRAPAREPEGAEQREGIADAPAERPFPHVTPSAADMGLHDDDYVRQPTDEDVARYRQAEDEARHNAANRNMVFGALWFVGGSIVTLVGFMASGKGGGSYVIAWGAIVFGALQFFRGLSQKSGGHVE